MKEIWSYILANPTVLVAIASALVAIASLLATVSAFVIYFLGARQAEKLEQNKTAPDLVIRPHSRVDGGCDFSIENHGGSPAEIIKMHAELDRVEGSSVRVEGSRPKYLLANEGVWAPELNMEQVEEVESFVCSIWFRNVSCRGGHVQKKVIEIKSLAADVSMDMSRNYRVSINDWPQRPLQVELRDKPTFDGGHFGRTLPDAARDFFRRWSSEKLSVEFGAQQQSDQEGTASEQEKEQEGEIKEQEEEFSEQEVEQEGMAKEQAEELNEQEIEMGSIDEH